MSSRRIEPLERARRDLYSVRLGRRMLPLASVFGLLGAFEVAAAVVGGDFGEGWRGVVAGLVGVSALVLWAQRKKCRRSLLGALADCVVPFAERRGGVLTVTEVAAELDISLDAAEELMMDMDDGSRVRSEISDEGVIYYEFPEFLGKEELLPLLGRSGGEVPTP